MIENLCVNGKIYIQYVVLWLIFFIPMVSFSSHHLLDSRLDSYTYRLLDEESTLASVSRLKEISLYKYHSGKIRINKLYSGSESIGNTMWMSSSNIRAKYFAYNNPFQRYRYWKVLSKPKMVLACSGSYSYKRQDGEFIPAALTIDHGKTINKNLRTDMDGLVLIYNTGKLRFANLDFVTLHGIDPNHFKNNNSKLRSYSSRSNFFGWASNNTISAFQTHLLIFKGKKMYQSKLARTEKAERRLLLLVKDKSNNFNHLIFNITKKVYLGEITDLVYNYLVLKGYEVLTLINLDTGMMDFMEVYRSNGTINPTLKGSRNVDMKKASSILTFYIKE